MFLFRIFYNSCLCKNYFVFNRFWWISVAKTKCILSLEEGEGSEIRFFEHNFWASSWDYNKEGLNLLEYFLHYFFSKISRNFQEMILETHCLFSLLKKNLTNYDIVSRDWLVQKQNKIFLLQNFQHTCKSLHITCMYTTSLHIKLWSHLKAIPL